MAADATTHGISGSQPRGDVILADTRNFPGVMKPPP